MGPGPSPRARGSPLPGLVGQPLAGSIPASAGKPQTAGAAKQRSEVHPRERGEASSSLMPLPPPPGPSPRARGSRSPGGRAKVDHGSIPASAGKPGNSRGLPRLSGVHPRERGEASPARDEALFAAGPSPRARGSRAAGDRARTCTRSIPASAGKPRRAHRRRRRRGVHPRERGEADNSGPVAARCVGPSPRARGSPSHVRPSSSRPGSIPASAGKPACGRGSARELKVHPRERGEALQTLERGFRAAGPSPRARGSPRRRARRW